jgi:hypothetical protein
MTVPRAYQATGSQGPEDLSGGEGETGRHSPDARALFEVGLSATCKRLDCAATLALTTPKILVLDESETKSRFVETVVVHLVPVHKKSNARQETLCYAKTIVITTRFATMRLCMSEVRPNDKCI